MNTNNINNIIDDMVEIYELSFQDILLGTLTVDTVVDKYDFEPYYPGVDAVKYETVLTVEAEKGTDGFVSPIPFFQNRIQNMKRLNTDEIRYHTDYFLLRKVNR